MTQKLILAGSGVLLLLLVMCMHQPAAWAAPQQAQQPTQQTQQPSQQQTQQSTQQQTPQNPGYTVAEYNAYQAAAKETNPQQRIKMLDDLVAKLSPTSTLLPYAYVVYYRTYYELKNYPQTINYADRLLALGDKIDLGTQLEARVARAQAYYLGSAQKELTAPDQATKARDAAVQGLKDLANWKKPENITDEQYAQQKKSIGLLFNSIAGMTAAQLKDNKAAIDYYKAALTIDPKDPNVAVTYYRLGLAYLQMEPAQYTDGFWALARSVSMKGPGEAQVRAYLHNQLLRYQQTGCEKLLDSEMNELISLAANSPERPPTYTVPSAADLQKAREQTTNFIIDLKAGGDKAKLVWLATCGLEFPEVVGKVIETSTTGTAVDLKLYNGTTPEEIEAATTANMEAKVEGQPDAKRISKDDVVRFSATLAGYDPEPFMLHWDKAKVNPEDIPTEKGGKQPGKRPVRRPPSKRPGK